MLNHGRRSISIPTGGAFQGFPAKAVPEDTKFYTPEEIEKMMAAKQQAESTWPGKKEPSEPSNPEDPEEESHT